MAYKCMHEDYAKVMNKVFTMRRQFFIVVYKFITYYKP